MLLDARPHWPNRKLSGQGDEILAGIRCPTTLWYGVEDHWQAGEWVAARIPQATLRVLPDRGHLVVFQDWDLVLDDLGFRPNG